MGTPRAADQMPAPARAHVPAPVHPGRGHEHAAHAREASGPSARATRHWDSWGSLSGREKASVVMLVALYMAQAIPTRLLGKSLEIVLNERGLLASRDLGLLHLAWIPYAFKLLWAPVVDALHVPAIGRRKQWIAFTQLLLVGLLWHAAAMVDGIFSGAETSKVFLAAIVFLVNALAATQDIAVDGWAFTLFAEAHVDWGTTAQHIGLTLSEFFAQTIFPILNSESFCDEHIHPLLGTPPGPILELGPLLRAIATAMLAGTVALAIMKAEEPAPARSSSIRQAYASLWRIVAQPDFMCLALLLPALRVGYTTDSELTGLRLQTRGFRQDQKAILSCLQTVMKLSLGVGVVHWLQGRQPLLVLLRATSVRLVLAVCNLCVVYLYPFDGAWLAIGALAFVQTGCMAVAGACTNIFYSRISDPDLGGMHLTALFTLSNLSLWLTGLLPRALVYLLDTIASLFQSADTTTPQTDWYYAIALVAIPAGGAILARLLPVAARLQARPRPWRVAPGPAPAPGSRAPM